MTGVEKLIEAAEVVLPIIDRDTDAVNALRDAIAPARAEWEKMRGECAMVLAGNDALEFQLRNLAMENDRLRAELAAERSVVMQLAGPKPVDPSRKAIVDAVEEWVNRARGGDATVDEIATALLEAATRAGWMVEPSAELAAACALPPAEDKIADAIFKNVDWSSDGWSERRYLSGVPEAARAILALLRDGGEK